MEKFEKRKEFLVCLDSDGSVFDSMEDKHRECFGPRWIEVFNLQSHYQEAMMIWLKTNLYSKSRGVNRFIALEICLKEMEKIGVEIEGMSGFENWLLMDTEFSDMSLMSHIRKVESECLEKALIWSLRANRSFNLLIDNDKIFENVKDALDLISKTADIVCISDSNKISLEKEWKKNDLIKYVSAIYSQEDGSNEDCIEELLKLGYDRDKVIMLGDSPNDMDAAEKNGIKFFPIVVGQEPESWSQFKYEGFPKLLEGVYDEIYEKELKEVFEKVLCN